MRINADVLLHILAFCGKSFLYVGPVSKSWRHTLDNTQTSVCQAVASESRVTYILPTLRSNTALNHAAFFEASRNGNTGVLDRLVSNARPKGLYVCTTGAVAGGQLSALQWAYYKGYPLDRFVCHTAAISGNLPMISWSVRKGCPWDPVRCREVAEQNGHFEIVDWIDRSIFSFPSWFEPR